MTDSDLEERKTITVEIPLDPLHRRADLALREAGIQTEEMVEEDVARAAERTIYAAAQAVKYEQQE